MVFAAGLFESRKKGIQMYMVGISEIWIMLMMDYLNLINLYWEAKISYSRIGLAVKHWQNVKFSPLRMSQQLLVS